MRFLAIAIPLLLSIAQPALAQGDPRTRTDIDKGLADQLYREQQQNRGCKIAVCETIRSRAVQAGNVACHVAKTWPDIDIKNRLLKGVINWPWGHTRCEGEFAIDRQLIAASVAGPRSEVKVGKHNVAC